ncbi:sensor histidine kinase [sulfur-oxidizing endosymbiont of Gigantopelta aegis]|uniref:sensor histidine kinase n=1 Tax=sulfur-oxidizing endosymbiont of Gigantopelta aegis TaxID=2794934 RepID=UPI0018DEA6A8|nr:HAMP domain-containing sensor histidine kinase [sulfur-oxidizing endosymbiont of Gigantopelta aegis]
MLKIIEQSFKRKIIFLMLTVSIIFSIPIFYAYYTSEKDKLNDILKRQITQLSQKFSLVVKKDVLYNNYLTLSDDIFDVYNYSLRTKEKKGSLYSILSIAVIDADGNILGHSSPGDNPILTHYKHDLTLTKKSPLIEQEKTTLHWPEDSNLIKIRTPIFLNSEIIGYIIIDIDAIILKSNERKLQLNIFIIFLILVITLITIIIILSSWIEKPLSYIMSQVNNIGNGDINFPELEKREDEFFVLANALKYADRRIHQQTQDLINNKRELENKVQERTKELEASSIELSQAMEVLQHSQKQLIESEKMSSLGSLVAGVAHEINTPIGISLTGITHIQSETKTIIDSMKEEILGRNALVDYLEMIDEMSNSMHLSLISAADLIRSFKQVAVDQHIEDKRTFDLREYVDEILRSLHNKIKHTNITIINNISRNVLIHSYAGIYSQVMTNFIMNSINHGFDEGQEGEIIISGKFEGKFLEITYSDTGKGIDSEIIDKIFDPFFTTKLGQGGSGLGLNIVYNLITHKLNGEITCENLLSGGIIMFIKIPLSELKIE